MYNSIIKDDVTWEEKELSEVQQSKLALCRAICEQLLADNDVLLEDRIKLNYYMSGHQEYPIRDFYLHQALLSVGALEKLNASGGKIRPDPLRQILETQMRLAEESKFINALNNFAVDVSCTNILHIIFCSCAFTHVFV